LGPCGAPVAANEELMSRLPQKSAGLLRDLERRVDEAFAELMHGPWRGPSAAMGWEPAIDVRESPQEYLVLVDLPGVMPGEVNVQVEGRTLVVRGKRTSQQWAQAGAMIYTERLQGEFVRRVFPNNAPDSWRCTKRPAAGATST
jgi:HSP20 family molecular chaperone IbpA